MVSVVIPVYNAEMYIEQCIKSIINQIDEESEIVLVDDGSQDNSLLICRKYESERIKVFHQENAGPIAARQKGAAEATGKYIWFVDADDLIKKNCWKTVIGILKKYNPDILCFGYERLGKKIEGENITGDGKYFEKKDIETEIIPTMLYSEGFFEFGIEPSLGNKIIKSDLVNNYIYNVPRSVFMGEDGLTVYQCLWKAQSLYRMKDSLYLYRYNSDSITSNRNRNLLQQNRDLFNAWENLMTSFLSIYRQQFECYQEYLFWFALEDEFIKVYLNETCFLSRFRKINKIKQVVNEDACLLKFDLKKWKNISLLQKVKIFLMKHCYYKVLFALWIFNNRKTLKQMRKRKK